MAGTGDEQAPPELEAGYVKLHYYLHEAPGESYFQVLPPLNGPGDKSYFGATFVGDRNITTTPDPASTLVGRAKGIVLAANNDSKSNSVGAVVSTTLVFNEASGYGSGTISWQGYNDIGLPVREIAITGGTGKFRLARGWIEFSTLDGGNEKALGARLVVQVIAHVYYGK